MDEVAEFKIQLTDSTLADHPGQPEEEHDAPNVEEASHEDALQPSEFNDFALFLDRLFILGVLKRNEDHFKNGVLL